MKEFVLASVSPTRAFQAVRDRKGGWIWPLVVTMALMLLAMWLMEPGFRAIKEEAWKAASSQGATREQFDLIFSLQRYLVPTLGVIVAIFFGGLILMLINWIVRGEAKYMQLVKVYLYSYLPVVIGQLLVGILVRATGTDDVREMMLNGAALLDESAGFLRRIAALADPFYIWSLVVGVFGAAVMMRRPPARIAMWLVIVWILLTLAGLNG